MSPAIIRPARSGAKGSRKQARRDGTRSGRMAPGSWTASGGSHQRPGGGSPEKPVGLVHFGAVRAGHEPIAERHVFPGDRDNIRRLTVLTALAMVCSLAER